MKDKIEVGEYVRSLINGSISKVLEISDLLEDLEEPKIKYYKTGQFTGFCSTEEYNFKHSKNIKDLIEIGDYVNGERVLNVDWGGVEITNFEYIEPKDIKSIVTKEMMEQIEYRIK